MNELVFWAGMFLIVVASMLYKPRGKPPSPPEKKTTDGLVEVVETGSIPGPGPH